jgi:hypothetical protein
MQSRQAQLEQVAGLLARRLDERTLIVVLAQLLDADVAEVPQTPNVRAGEFRQLLGGISKSLWHEWKRQGRIPPGRKLSEGIEYWTREVAVATAATIAEEHAKSKPAVL